MKLNATAFALACGIHVGCSGCCIAHLVDPAPGWRFHRTARSSRVDLPWLFRVTFAGSFIGIGVGASSTA